MQSYFSFANRVKSFLHRDSGASHYQNTDAFPVGMGDNCKKRNEKY
jgi:hypothetical protein